MIFDLYELVNVLIFALSFQHVSDHCMGNAVDWVEQVNQKHWANSENEIMTLHICLFKNHIE